MVNHVVNWDGAFRIAGMQRIARYGGWKPPLRSPTESPSTAWMSPMCNTRVAHRRATCNKKGGP